ncbi:hypothetical protein [Heyndrickxia oleronia]|uniref:hypothetical protein n=1 Tax=Heyndrickxia oleronia TaxID=38875 RepID=UPI002430CDB4|nr:hypothetical protein [Heyndrickxia oleronia]MCI1593053.1 hypothetical protein [Heyndrickxia oleronia]MCI1615779.1 hypothetical protein [Heyndrickxia oleronia]MCI1746412.1 hypothetical protein [Heyndrickxia oleronia]MCI1764160.1 hypothetical protein [Heyndrickxia oleronia]
MKYLKDIQEPGMGTWYFEIDNDGVAYRQMVYHDDGTCITSNRKHNFYHFMLAEHPLNTQESYYKEINQAEFEELWYEQLQLGLEDWRRTKSLFPVGTRVVGDIEAFFPQGTLINLMETQAVGITDTSALQSETPAEWMYPRYRVIAEVSGYDEVNYWVLLTRAEVIGSQFEEAGHM